MRNAEFNDEQHLIEELFKNLYKPLRAYAYRFLNNKDMAEDIVQDVFCELWLKRTSIRLGDQDAVKSYLFKSVYNRSINLLNHIQQEEQYCRQKQENNNLDIERQLNECFQAQEQFMFLQVMKTEIEGFLETLPLQRKKVFILSRKNELKNREIAELLGISVKAVEKHITLVLHDLKDYLFKQGVLP
ncbi:DNA-directed RNA polymerase sigma-70 factor [Bacteroidia bacterium]|nr:DNA-directed RNA polymerase sigma-70 factor [Bacteroidia bacterium]GHU78117.1 DNA-directed RNA polymerase sigma-70 factor [Bacteroidia bacterium]GHV05100.1 DNA-directed RNA polymerase sigma-70 factor [Bacteroidia bacterium]